MYNFAKVSTLLNVPYTIAIDLTFENLHLALGLIDFEAKHQNDPNQRIHNKHCEVATISRLLQIIGRFGTISSLL